MGTTAASAYDNAAGFVASLSTSATAYWAKEPGATP
jgi:hypothetical protein